VTVNGVKNVTANFGINTYTLTINRVGNGNVSKSPNSSTFTHGQIVTLTANPSGSGTKFLAWSGDTAATTNPLPLPMISNRNITATFVETQPPTVTVLSPNGGESWTTGQTAVVTWSASDNVSVTSIDILVGRNGVNGPLDTLVTGIPNSGSWTWMV